MDKSNRANASPSNTDTTTDSEHGIRGSNNRSGERESESENNLYYLISDPSIANRAL